MDLNWLFYIRPASEACVDEQLSLVFLVFAQVAWLRFCFGPRMHQPGAASALSARAGTCASMVIENGTRSLS